MFDSCMQILPTAWKINFCEGKERELVIEEVSQLTKFLENELHGKDFFGGEAIGLVDIVALVIAFWFPLTQELIGIEAFTGKNALCYSNGLESSKKLM